LQGKQPAQSGNQASLDLKKVIANTAADGTGLKVVSGSSDDIVTGYQKSNQSWLTLSGTTLQIGYPDQMGTLKSPTNWFTKVTNSVATSDVSASPIIINDLPDLVVTSLDVTPGNTVNFCIYTVDTNGAKCIYPAPNQNSRLSTSLEISGLDNSKEYQLQD